MDKSPEAFRTISEAAEILDTPAHVLRFWESRFPQIRPVKRAGGRRYYRPADMALLTGIKHLLHAEGMTIRGVQKVLRDQGVRHVANLLGGGDLVDLDLDAETALEQALAANFDIETVELPPERAETATIIALETALRRPVAQTVDTAIPAVPPTAAPSIPAELKISDIIDVTAQNLEMKFVWVSDNGPDEASIISDRPPVKAGSGIAPTQLAIRMEALPQGALRFKRRQARNLRNRLLILRNAMALKSASPDI